MLQNERNNVSLIVLMTIRLNNVLCKQACFMKINYYTHLDIWLAIKGSADETNMIKILAKTFRIAYSLIASCSLKKFVTLIRN